MHRGLVGTFNNGRVEGYAPGRVLIPDELRQPSMSAKIGSALARLHTIDVPAHAADRHKPSLWRMLDLWLTLIAADGVEWPAGVDEPAVRGAITALRARIEGITHDHHEGAARSSSPPAVVFAHNDASALNLVYDEARDRVSLIDFEYARYNYRGFDLANHFSEYAGSGPIRWERLPSEAEQLAFLRHYARAVHRHGGAQQQQRPARAASAVLHHEGHGGDGHGEVQGEKQDALADIAKEMTTAAADAEARALYAEVQAFYPAVHLFWGLWGLYTSAEHAAEHADEAAEGFDYRGYAEELLLRALAAC